MSVCNRKPSDPLYKELLVFGYCRECERKAQITIPEDIKYFCCVFYSKHEDYFERIGNRIVISKDRTLICCNECLTYNTCYGAIEIKPSENKIYHWVFAIQKLCDSICIGIDQIGSNWMDTWFAGRKETDHFVISNKTRFACNKGWESLKLEESNIVIMRLDFSNSANARWKSSGIARYGTMECCVLRNCLDAHRLVYQNIFDNIEKNRNYKMAVELRGGWVIQCIAPQLNYWIILRMKRI
eukprot:398345_1